MIVQQIVELPAQLEVRALGEVEVLVHVHIELGLAVQAQHVAPESSVIAE